MFYLNLAFVLQQLQQSTPVFQFNGISQSSETINKITKDCLIQKLLVMFLKLTPLPDQEARQELQRSQQDDNHLHGQQETRHYIRRYADA